MQSHLAAGSASGAVPGPGLDSALHFIAWRPGLFMHHMWPLNHCVIHARCPADVLICSCAIPGQPAAAVEELLVSHDIVRAVCSGTELLPLPQLPGVQRTAILGTDRGARLCCRLGSPPTLASILYTP